MTSGRGFATRPAVRSICGCRRGRSTSPAGSLDDEVRQGIVDGAYWLRKPGPNCEVVVAYQGAIAPEAMEAIGLMAEDRRDVGLLAVTSADRLNAGWTAANRARERGLVHARCHAERLLADVPRHCGIVTVIDGHPATLGWLGSVLGHRVRPLGIEHFGQTGTLQDLYRHYGIDANAIVAAAESVVARPADPAHRGAAGDVSGQSSGGRRRRDDDGRVVGRGGRNRLDAQARAAAVGEQHDGDDHAVDDLASGLRHLHHRQHALEEHDQDRARDDAGVACPSRRGCWCRR